MMIITIVMSTIVEVVCTVYSMVCVYSLYLIVIMLSEQ